jgi:hypothetical protein
MQRGYVKLWRRSIDNGWLQNHLLWAFWCWCLLKASHKQKDITVGFQRVVLEPGQFVFGRNNAAKELRASPQNIRTCVQTLIKTQNLTIKSTNRFSIISIINWDSYQQEENNINQQTNKQLTSNQPATNHKQECKAFKNVKNKEERVSIPDWIDSALWDDFKEFRIRIKAPLTNRAIKNIIAELEKLIAQGQDPNACVSQSITRGWRGVFAVKGDQQQEDVDAWIRKVSQS